MAEGPYKNASEELQNECAVNVECDPCKEDGSTVPAVGFCVDCNDYLCTPCYTAHKIPRPSKHHVLQDKFSMPPVKPARKGVPCLVHITEFVTQHCNTHDEVLCEICMIQEHLKCDLVDINPALFEGLRNSSEFKTCLESVAECAVECRRNFEVIDGAITGIDQAYVLTQQRVERILKALKENDRRWNKALRCKSETLLGEIETVQKDLESTKGDDEFSFIKMKMAKKIVYKSRKHSNLLKVGNAITKYGVKATGVDRNGSTPLLWTDNNEYYLIPVDSIKREKNLPAEIRGIAGYGRHIFAFVWYSTNFSRWPVARSIVSVDSATGHIENTLSMAQKARGICDSGHANTGISYISDSLLLCVDNPMGKEVLIYREYKGNGAIVTPDTQLIEINGSTKLVGKTVIDSRNRVGTVRFQVIGEKAVNTIDVDKGLGNVIYHDNELGTMLSSRGQFLTLFNVANLNTIRKKDMRTEVSGGLVVVKYGAKFYILCKGNGVFECNAEDLSDWCRVVKVNGATSCCEHMAINERHICLATTPEGLIAVFRKP